MDLGVADRTAAVLRRCQ